MRKLARIEVIDKLEPIAGADKILKATVKGWECVVSVNDGFNAGDKVIYVEVDSILPPRPEFEFLRPRNFRVRTIKLRGQVSQGLILPMSLLGGEHEIGEDVTGLLGIKKYDPQLVEEKKVLKEPKTNNKVLRFMMRFDWFRKLYRKFVPENEKFPTEIASKTDEERVQNLPNEYKEWSLRHIPFEVTEKLDGCSATYFLEGNTFGVCSRNIWLKREDDSHYWKVAKHLQIEDSLKVLQEKFSAKKVVIQGEILGEGIQGNKYHKYLDFYVFNIIVDGIKLDQESMDFVCRELALNTVPTLYTNFCLPNDMQELVKVSEGKSVVYNTLREGLVLRNYKEGISFKVINPSFLLKE